MVCVWGKIGLYILNRFPPVCDSHLTVASVPLAQELRAAVYKELGYRCSAGVAHNKVLAKIGSAFNKPNAQTVIRQGAVLQVLRDLPLKKIKNLGGKTGRAVAEELGVCGVQPGAFIA